MHTAVDVAHVQAADTLEDVAEEINGAILYTEYGPDYERHFRAVFADVAEEMEESAKRVAKYLKQKGKRMERIFRPTDKVRDILDGRRSECREISTQFFVTNLKLLAELVDGIEKGAKKALKGRKQVSVLREWKKKEKKKSG